MTGDHHFWILLGLCTVFPGSSAGQDFQRLRQLMVDEQIAARDIRDPAVIAAMRKVPRHEFVPTRYRGAAYEDYPLPIGYGQTISQPYIVGFMTQAARIGPNDRVLEIGTGSGYQAAVLAEIAREVYTIELIEDLARESGDRLKRLGYKNIHTRAGDGYAGWAEFAPYDAILVTAAPPAVPEALIEQLKVGGRMVIPVGDLFQFLLLLEKTPRGIKESRLLPVRFVPMVPGKKSP